MTLEPGGPDCAGSEYLAWWRFFVPFLAYLDPAIQTSDPEIFSRILHPCDSKLRSVIPNPVRSDSIPLLILVCLANIHNVVCGDNVGSELAHYRLS